jgi:hypothetical protein
LCIGALTTAVALAFGCSSSSGTGSPGPATGGGCDGASCQDAASSTDAGPTEDAFHPDGPRDGAAPDALYGCAVTGSFGSPCSATTSGPDPTDCTDPNYPDCFVGGQGAWCTKTCTPGSATDCTMGVEDAGCVPSACNARGYCK